MDDWLAVKVKTLENGSVYRQDANWKDGKLDRHVDGEIIEVKENGLFGRILEIYDTGSNIVIADEPEETNYASTSNDYSSNYSNSNNEFDINIIGPDWFVEKTERALRIAKRSKTARRNISLLKTIQLSAHELGVNATVGAANPDFMDFGYVWVDPNVENRDDEDYMGTLTHEGAHCWLTLNGYNPNDEDYPSEQREIAQREV